MPYLHVLYNYIVIFSTFSKLINRFASILYNRCIICIIPGVDECVCLNLHYSGGRIARLMCHADAHVDNLATIYGTEGNINVRQHFCLIVFTFYLYSVP